MRFCDRAVHPQGYWGWMNIVSPGVIELMTTADISSESSAKCSDLTTTMSDRDLLQTLIIVHAVTERRLQAAAYLKILQELLSDTKSCASSG